MFVEKTLLSPGTLVQNRYLVEEILGTGGFGAVYRVSDQQSEGALFALKEVIEPTQQERDRLAHEGELLERLHDPALPRVYRLFTDEQGNRSYLLMEFIHGLNLELVRQQQPHWRFTVPEALEIMTPVINAVIYLHRQHPPLLHRDIKPANIVLKTISREAILVDFGIAKEYDPENTTTMLRHGSPGYAAPEHYCSGTDPRTDIYGLGATMYTLLTGYVPVDALMRMTHQTSKDKDPLEPVKHLTAEVPGPVADVIHRALSLRAEARFETVEQFWQSLYQASLDYPSPPPRLWSLSAASLRMRARSVTEHVPTLAFLNRSPASYTWRQRILPFLLLVLLLIGLGLGSEFRSQVMNQPGTVPTPSIPTQHQPTQTAPSRSRKVAPVSTQVSHPPVKTHHPYHGDGSNSDNQGGQGR